MTNLNCFLYAILCLLTNFCCYQFLKARMILKECRRNHETIKPSKKIKKENKQKREAEGTTAENPIHIE